MKSTLARLELGWLIGCTLTLAYGAVADGWLGLMFYGFFVVPVWVVGAVVMAWIAEEIEGRKRK